MSKGHKRQLEETSVGLRWDSFGIITTVDYSESLHS